MADKSAAKKIQEEVQKDVKLTQLIVFHVADEEFGVPIGEIQEIIRMKAITPIPDSPEFIKGLINVRGDIVAVIDVKARFSLPRDEKVVPKHIIITKRDETPFGLIVDEVTEVLRIPETEIKKAPELVTHLHQQYVTGVVTIENRLLILIDLAQVLSEEELERLVEAQRHVPETVKAEKQESQPPAEKGVSP